MKNNCYLCVFSHDKSRVFTRCCCIIFNILFTVGEQEYEKLLSLLLLSVVPNQSIILTSPVVTKNSHQRFRSGFILFFEQIEKYPLTLFPQHPKSKNYAANKEKMEGGDKMASTQEE